MKIPVNKKSLIFLGIIFLILLQQHYVVIYAEDYKYVGWLARNSWSLVVSQLLQTAKIFAICFISGRIVAEVTNYELKLRT